MRLFVSSSAVSNLCPTPTATLARGRYHMRFSIALSKVVVAVFSLTSMMMMMMILAVIPGVSASVPPTSGEKEGPQVAELPWVGTRPEPLTPAEREAKLQNIIERQQAMSKDKDITKEVKLFDLLQGWSALYEKEGEAALQTWYKTAKAEVFTIGVPTDSPQCEEGDDTSGETKLDAETETLLMDSLQEWDELYEENGKYALFEWYKAARYSIFGMPKFESVYFAEYETDTSDLFYLGSRIDSHHGTYSHLMDYFECHESAYSVEAYNDEKIWMFLRHLYVGIVGKEKSTLKKMDGFGFEVPVRFQYSEGKGRGVYAVEDIPENTIVMNTTVFCASFDNGVDYRRYVASLPPNLACDILMWSYGYNSDNLDPTTLNIAIDLDGGGMMNDGGYLDDELGETNNLKKLCKGCGIWTANRDIKAGEELEMAYSSFSTKVYRWEYFGLE